MRRIGAALALLVAALVTRMTPQPGRLARRNRHRSPPGREGLRGPAAHRRRAGPYGRDPVLVIAILLIGAALL